VTTSEDKETLVAAFGTDIDPLAVHEPTFETIDVDPFDPFRTDVLEPGVSRRTQSNYETLWRQWREYMTRVGRHPACPNVDHVQGFARYELDEKGNQPRTVAEKLRKLGKIYAYWQKSPVFPHAAEFDPIRLARMGLDLSFRERKSPPPIPLTELPRLVESITHCRDHALVVCQLKLGLRATELCNLTLGEVHLDEPLLQTRYPELGNHERLVDRPNAVYIPHDREGNKSRCPRVLPLDDELQSVLTEYLLRRPTVDDPWVFLSKTNHNPLRKEAINTVWKNTFHPQYAETDRYRAVTSHYGRHRFSTYWRVEQDLTRELLQYLRGDTPGATEFGELGTLDEYLHTYYEDIEEIYRERMYSILS
jgi:integrase/recombinase XerD